MFHLVIVDNESSDETTAILRDIDDPRISVIFNPTNVGFAVASNQGIRWALARHAARVVLINNDTEFDDTLLADLDAHLDELRADVITPRIPFYDRSGFAWYAGGSFARLRGIMSFHDYYGQKWTSIPAAPRRVDFAPGCCLMFDRSVFVKVGLLDEHYFVYWEDSDLCWRIKRAGLTLWYDPRLSILHKVSSSTGGGNSDFSIRHIHSSQMYYVRKFHNTFWLFYTIAVMAIKILFRRVSGEDTSRQTRARFAAMRAGLRMPTADC